MTDTPRWSKHDVLVDDQYRDPEVVAELEAADPTTDVDVLRRAAEDLRSPFLCNWDPQVAAALAGAMEQIARVIRLDPGMVHRVGYDAIVRVAWAFMARMVSR